MGLRAMAVSVVRGRTFDESYDKRWTMDMYNWLPRWMEAQQASTTGRRHRA